MKKAFGRGIGKFAAAGALAASCGMAFGQQVLFDSGSSDQCIFNGNTTTLGWTSGQVSGGAQRWFAAPFTLTTNSVITEIDYNTFDIAGSDYLRIGYGIWHRQAGDPAPGVADEVFVSGMNPAGNTDFEPYSVTIQDPRQPVGTTFFRKLVLTNPKTLPAGNYYLSLWADSVAATNTTGFAQNAWATNAQVNTTFCPVNTPIALPGPGPNGRAYHGYRAANYPSPGFAAYDVPVATLVVATAPAWGPVPQNEAYLWSPGFTLIGTPTGTLQGACCLANGGCSFTDATTCCGSGGTYRGNGVTCANANCPLAGACCKADGTCLVTTQSTCTNATNLGDYQGDNTSCGNCPPRGACCLENGSCVLSYNLACTSQGGLYRGNNVPCGGTASACVPFGFTGDDINSDVGDTLATATPVNGYGQKLAFIHGYIGLGDRADVYKIQICDRTTFNASTVGNGNTLDTELALFDRNGKGLTFDDDTGNGTTQTSAQSIITGQFVPSNGYYYLGIAEFNNTTGIAAPSLPLDSTGAMIWTEPSPWNGTTNPVGGTGFPEWPPNGPSTTQILAANDPAWSVDPDTFGNYTIALTGACFLGCYANCDGSTTPPILNANDFQCFLNAFAGSLQPGMFPGYANCDNSTAAPILNANDFQCFLNAYAAGCNS
jgi:hypothetical protein